MGDGEVAEGQAGSGVENASAQEALSYLTLTKWDDFLRDLSVDSRAEEGSLVMVAARSMWSSALPPNWSEQIDEEHSRAYFFNRVSGESVWVHPQSDVFRELIEEVRRWPPDESVDHIVRLRDEHLRRAHQAAVDALAQWSAYDVPQGPEEAPEFGECTRLFWGTLGGAPPPGGSSSEAQNEMPSFAVTSPRADSGASEQAAELCGHEPAWGREIRLREQAACAAAILVQSSHGRPPSRTWGLSSPPRDSKSCRSPSGALPPPPQRASEVLLQCDHEREQVVGPARVLGVRARPLVRHLGQLCARGPLRESAVSDPAHCFLTPSCRLAVASARGGL